MLLTPLGANFCCDSMLGGMNRKTSHVARSSGPLLLLYVMINTPMDIFALEWTAESDFWTESKLPSKQKQKLFFVPIKIK